MNVTFTGIDWSTVIPLLPVGPEYGVLYSVSRSESTDHRYPGFKQVHQILLDLDNFGHTSALHICGSPALDLLKLGHLHPFTFLANRIQINGIINEEELVEISKVVANTRLITQHNNKTENLYTQPIDLQNGCTHQLLMDQSGGTGKSPKEWKYPNVTGFDVGFAGGLGGVDTVTQVNEIQKIAQGNWWIDMESKIRDKHDEFSVAAVSRIWNRIQQDI